MIQILCPVYLWPSIALTIANTNSKYGELDDDLVVIFLVSNKLGVHAVRYVIATLL